MMMTTRTNPQRKDKPPPPKGGTPFPKGGGVRAEIGRGLRRSGPLLKGGAPQGRGFVKIERSHTMKISISENIKRLRRERDMTQDDLAAVMGVTSQSVSKWETGTAYPDVETIPLLANYFDVSVDDLFGMASIRDEARIEEEMKRWLELVLQGPSTLTAQTELLGSLAREFPRHWKTQQMYAASLIQPAAKSEDNRKAIEVITRILDECKEDEYRNEANALLIRAYEAIGEHEKAVALAEKLPSMHQAQEPTLHGLRLREAAMANDRDKLLRLYREYAAHGARAVQSPLNGLLNLCLHLKIADDEFHLNCLQTEMFLHKLMMYDAPADSEAIRSRNASYEMSLTGFYASRDGEKALEHLERYVELKLALPREGGHKSWRNDGSRDENGEFIYVEESLTAEESIKMSFANEVFDTIRREPRFIAAVQRLLDYENEAAE
jgi:transcriptional regulator with XRE-family HTH domain